MNLVSLEDYNYAARKQASMTFDDQMQLNGIACPRCKKELADTTAEMLTSFPAQKRVKCSACNYSGLRVVP